MPQPVNHPSLYIYVFLEEWLTQWSLKQKEEDLEQMEATIQSLIVKERASNDEARGSRGVDQCNYIFVRKLHLLFWWMFLGSDITFNRTCSLKK